MAGVKLVSLLLVCMVVAPLTTQAISCGGVSSALAPCINYLKGTEPAPQPACCSGVKSISSAAQTTPDRKTACGCLKSAASSIPGLHDALAASLPGKCGVSIPYKISMSTNCNSIK